MRIVTKIELIFENCESTVVKEDDIKFLNISGIKKEIFRFACNAISEMISAEVVEMIIDGSYKPEGSIFGDYSAGERVLYYNDITSVIIYYDNGEEETLYVNWEDDGVNAYINSNQEVESDEENIYLVIEKEPQKALKDLIKKWASD